MAQCELFDLNALAEAKQTMKAKFPAMVQYFIEDSENYIAVMKAAMVAGNVEAIVSPAHTLKSSSRQVGALLVSLIAQDIEALSREQACRLESDMSAFLPLLASLESAFAETRLKLPAHAA